MIPSLIERLEQAVEGSRELDALVTVASGLADKINPKNPHYVRFLGDDIFSSAPRYTTSVDAALTLVPEGCAWAACGGDASDLMGNIRPSASVWERGQNPLVGDECFATTPALALCIAALRAREAA